jgi:trans-aconitate methyltransferase
MTTRKDHWENVYVTKNRDQLSWTQNNRSTSIEWMLRLSPNHDAKVIDIGGGTSEFVDQLLDAGFPSPTVLDISSSAIEKAKQRLGQNSQLVKWITTDVATFQPTEKYNLWHDRAAFHFLTKKEDRAHYIAVLKASLPIDGYALIATFAPNGPEKCSGLEVVRYSEEDLAAELGSDFELVKSQRETHVTPWGSEQAFVYCLFQKV